MVGSVGFEPIVSIAYKAIADSQPAAIPFLVFSCLDTIIGVGFRVKTFIFFDSSLTDAIYCNHKIQQDPLLLLRCVLAIFLSFGATSQNRTDTIKVRT